MSQPTAHQMFKLIRSLISDADHANPLGSVTGKIEMHEALHGYRRIKHKQAIYVDGDAYTNTIDSFFGLLNTRLRGVYHSVSRSYL